MVTPYEENHIGGNVYTRTFSHDIEEEELQWHWDEEDRIISPIGETDWRFQFDNMLPMPIRGEIFIKAGVMHRAIKGSGDLKIRLVKFI